jgi:hypothetical protein
MLCRDTVDISAQPFKHDFLSLEELSHSIHVTFELINPCYLEHRTQLIKSIVCSTAGSEGENQHLFNL